MNIKICKTWEEVIVGQKDTHQFLFNLDMSECTFEFRKKILKHFNKKDVSNSTQPYILGLYEDRIYFQMPNNEFRKVFKNTMKTALNIMGYDYVLNDDQESLTILNR